MSRDTGSHPDCRACAEERIKAEKRIAATGALRLEIMDYRAVLRSTLPKWLKAYDRDRRDMTDHMRQPTCAHGRVLTSACRRCENREER